MEDRNLNIIFFGSNHFSIPALKILHTKYNIKGIITKAPKPKNRGHKLEKNIVHIEGEKLQIENIYTTNKLKNNNDIFLKIKNLNPDFIIVVAYGLIIPDEIISLPRYNILNIHPSKLPFYRGAAPIERAIQNNEQEIDISIIDVVSQLDAGDIFKKSPFKINFEDHASDVKDQISEKGAFLMIETINDILNNQFTRIKQDQNFTYAEKIINEELQIDLQNDNGLAIYNKIRAFNFSGGAFFIHNGKKIKIFKAKFEPIKNQIYLGFFKDHWKLNDGNLFPLLLQSEGKKILPAKDFLNGIKLC